MTKPYDAEELAARLEVAARISGLRTHVQQLETLLPVCSFCRSILNEEKNWIPLDQYVLRKTGGALDRTCCPKCMDTEFDRELSRV